ncbi:MAG: substrate-binding domain-containing protein [Thermoplasmataceae archaeon]
MNRAYRLALIILFAVVLISAGVFLYTQKSTNSVRMYTADAYTGEAEFLLNEFHNQTGIPVEPPVSGGAYTDAREISMGSPASVFISVALNAYTPQFMGTHSPQWALAFASDSMVLAYSNLTDKHDVNSIVNTFKEAYSSNSSTLYRFAFDNLTNGSVKIGISDPISDPAGARAWIVLEIAGQLLDNSISYFSSRVVEHNANVTASNAADLISPLQDGQIQFLFIYRSAAITKGLPFIQLNDTFNLGNASLSGFYSGFQYTFNGQVFTGSPVLLYASVPSNESTEELGIHFMEFLLNNTDPLSGFGLKPLRTMILYGSSPPGPIEWGISRGIIEWGGSL